MSELTYYESVTDPRMNKGQRLALVAKIFTPGTPIRDRDLFAGRLEQVLQILSVLNQPGIQLVIYGERGVGKSSLANVLSQFSTVAGEAVVESVRVNCSTSDTFKSLWTRVFKAARISVPEEWTYRSPEPDEIRSILEDRGTPFIILDEFDRWENDEGLTAMADTIKALSDHAVNTKLVIVGVADSIDSLIGEHESVKRAIEEILLPRMFRDELLAIPTEGMKRIEIAIAPDIAGSIASLSEGLPSFAHLLSFHAAGICVSDDRYELTANDLLAAVERSVSKHSLLSTYKRAVTAQRKDTLHAKVLLACALASKDGLGYFTAADVREPMSDIMGRAYSIPAFSPHLKAFTESERGAVLRREGTERRYRWRFRDPLLQPFTVLTALSEGWLPVKYKERFVPAGEVGGVGNERPNQDPLI